MQPDPTVSSERNYAHRLLSRIVDIRAFEVPAVSTAFACNFVLMGSYYFLRPVRDAMATVFGVGELQHLFTGTLILTSYAPRPSPGSRIHSSSRGCCPGYSGF